MDYRIIEGDCIEGMRRLEGQSVNCVVTSPPYFGLRDYGHDGQIGLEASPEEFVAKLVEVFREVRRVLRDDGTVWLNLGDSYAGSWGNAGGHNRGNGTQREITVGSVVKDQAERNGDFVPPAANGYAELGIKKKDLIGIPWRVAFALQADGWYLRQDIIWHKPNPMPESVTDRCTKAHEYLFMLSKSHRYHYDSDAIKEPSVTQLSAPDANGSTLSGGAYGRHTLGEAIPEKDRRTDKQRGHGRRHAGFNERWDGMTKQEQGAMGRNKRSVWTVATRPYEGAHFAVFPPALIRPCILAGCPVGGTVLDPFGGSGTTAQVAIEDGREAILCELNPKYIPLIHQRMNGLQLRMPAA